MFDMIKKILISQKEFTKTNYQRLQKSFGMYTKQFDEL